MKKIFVMMLAAFFATASLTAQAQEYNWNDYRHSLSISVGCPSGYWAFRGLLVDVWVSALDHADRSHYYGAYGLNYHYQFLPWLRAGFKSSWEGDSYDIYAEKEKTHLKGHSFGHTIALMPSCQFTYLNFRYVQLYSGIDVGLEVMLRENHYINGYTDSYGKSDNISYTLLPAINVTAVGVCAGNERVYGLAEINIGADAIFKAGIGMHF